MLDQLHCGRYRFDNVTPRIMAILNVTPDSFSGDGLLKARDRVRWRADAAVAAGAAMLDVGGESSRPGADSVSEAEELERVIPVVEALADGGVPISVDTVKPVVMREALAAGASMINDINALRAEGAVDAVAQTAAGACLMHMQGEPRTMQQDPQYDDVVSEVMASLMARVAVVEAAGVAPERIVLDPGFGFGKTLEQNLALFRALPRFCERYPVLVGVSRKSMIGGVTGRPVDQRVVGSSVAAALAVQLGASWVRVHDVAETRDALAILAAVQNR